MPGVTAVPASCTQAARLTSNEAHAYNKCHVRQQLALAALPTCNSKRLLFLPPLAKPLLMRRMPLSFPSLLSHSLFLFMLFRTLSLLALFPPRAPAASFTAALSSATSVPFSFLPFASLQLPQHEGGTFRYSTTLDSAGVADTLNFQYAVSQ